ncbi:MAG TPA: tRNA pseudouridine(55) synthase TruB [Aquiluna sp.]
MASGLVLIDKPKGITSFDVVAKLRKILNTRKIGHAGTLDPMATGLMLLGVNQGTKLLQFLIGMDKQYLATIRLGVATVTDDAEGEVLTRADASHLTEEQIDAEIAKLRGPISQLPSSVSAKKIDGKRAYDLVREGQEFELKPKDVVISRFERLSDLRVDDCFVDFDVVVDCSSGTYIRALARDIGSALSVGGHLTALRRTSIGKYSIDTASEITDEVALSPMMESAREIFPEIEITSEQVVDVRHGKPLMLSSENEMVCLSHQGSLVAISKLAGGLYRSQIVLVEES